jgi:beta-glucosidase
MVLLKNDNHILPLNCEKIKKIAIIGALAKQMNVGDKGSSRVRPPYIVTHFEGIKKSAQGKCEISFNDGKNVANASELAKNSEAVVVIVGYTYKDEGENIVVVGGDRKRLTLNPKDEKLIQTIASVNSNVIVVMIGGSAIITENWRNSVPAILMAWYSGMEGGTALGEILFGTVNPSGKLPLPFPKSETDLPFFDKNAKQITYDYWHGYRKFDKEGKEAAFPYGFGLSYTTFKYSNIRITKEKFIQIKVDVTNNGNRDGTEIIQAYVGYPKSPVERAIKELKGFTKVFIKSGEIKTAEIQIKIEDLAYYNTEKNQWKVVAGDYLIFVGPSSNIKDCLSTSITIN